MWSRQTRWRRSECRLGMTGHYRIVGLDEVEFARALMSARPGEWSAFNLPIPNERH